MTTAHRPTWNAAQGGSAGTSEGYWATGGLTSRQFSSRDLPGQLTLKTRQPGQGTAAESLTREEMRAELARKEAQHLRLTEEDAQKDCIGEPLAIDSKQAALLLKSEAAEHAAATSKFDDRDDETESSSDEESSDDEDDETAELMRELEKIKAEREAERLRKEAAEKEVAQQQREAEMAHGNPLTQGGASGSAAMKRKWNHDVVFKNQARDEPEVKKRFVNDTIRNDFHRRFLSKYIQ
eukprot:g2568.t1